MTSPLMTSARTSSGRDDWTTPQGVIDRVLRVGPIAIDPCSNAQSIVPALRRIVLPDDGLQAEWGSGLAYVNPPYSAIRPWLERCAARPRAEGETLALIPARTDTKAWQEWASTTDAVCLWAGRLRFGGAPRERARGWGAPFPSAILYWGSRAWRFVDAFADAGLVYAGAPRRRFTERARKPARARRSPARRSSNREPTS